MYRELWDRRHKRGHAKQLVHAVRALMYPGGQWASYQIRKIPSCACAGNDFPRVWLQRKPLVSDPGMHHGTCVTHVPWCMSGSLTRDGGENVPGIPGACAPAILRIWQEAHGCPIMTLNIWFWYTKKPKFASRQAGSRKSMHVFVGHVHSNVFVTSLWFRCH